MKKIILCLFAAVLTLMQVPCVAADDAPVFANALSDGEYEIAVESSSSMFRIVGCTLTVSDGKMTAVMTLSGKGYEKLYMGTGEEAAAAPDSEYIYFTEDDEGKYIYAVPVEALDTEINCAAWSIKKQKWYDRTLVFKSAGLPKTAFKRGFPVLPVTAAAVAAVIIAAAVIIVRGRRKNDGA